MPGETETRIFVQHELCECTCRLNENACSSNQKWKHHERLCWCKEIDF